MRRKKLRALVRDVLDERRAIGDRPVTLDTLEVRWNERAVIFRGRRITTESDAITFPILSTDRMIITHGEVI